MAKNYWKWGMARQCAVHSEPPLKQLAAAVEACWKAGIFVAATIMAPELQTNTTAGKATADKAKPDELRLHLMVPAELRASAFIHQKFQQQLPASTSTAQLLVGVGDRLGAAAGGLTGTDVVATGTGLRLTPATKTKAVQTDLGGAASGRGFIDVKAQCASHLGTKNHAHTATPATTLPTTATACCFPLALIT